MSRLRFVPLALFLLLAGAVAWRLAVPRDDRIASRLAGQLVPRFALPPAVATKPGLRSTDLADGRPRLVNIFASWCVPCITETPLLLELRRQGVPIDAIAVRDSGPAVSAFLARHGDPFDRIGSDVDSQVQIALGSSGVPETFLLDGQGRIRAQHIGPIAPGDVAALVAQWRRLK